MPGIKSPPVLRASAAQLVVAAVSAGAALIVLGGVAAYSFLLGALISILPGVYFARKVFSHMGARSTGRIVRSFYVGEAVKLGMMAGGFALAFIYVEPLNAAALFAGFVVTHIAGIVTLAMMRMM